MVPRRARDRLHVRPPRRARPRRRHRSLAGGGPGHGSEVGAPRRLTATAGPGRPRPPSPPPATPSPTWDGPRPSTFGGNVRLFAIPVAGGAAALSHRRLRSLLLAARRRRRSGVPTAARSRWPRRIRAPRRVPGAGRAAAPVTRIVAASGSSPASRVPRRPDPRLRGDRARLPPARDLRLRRRTAAASEQLTDLNRDWKREVALRPPGALPLRAGRHDGRRLDHEAVRLEAPARAVPCSLNIHGGPHAQYGYPFLDEFQVQAGAGYGVIYTNPRGSQGYGEAFTRAVVGDWGGGDYADVHGGLDEALARHPTGSIAIAARACWAAATAVSDELDRRPLRSASRPPARSAR